VIASVSEENEDADMLPPKADAPALPDAGIDASPPEQSARDRAVIVIMNTRKYFYIF
jgi:hypothetical protein